MPNLGIDYASHGHLDSKGQVPIVSDIDNILQAIRNRLLTYKGTYSYIDVDYGSSLKDYIGLTDNAITRQLVCLEIETVVSNDSRVVSAKVEYDNGNYNLKVTLITGDEINIGDLF